MLTNEEIEQMKGVVRKCIYGIPDSEGQVARDTLDQIVAELLTLREAVAPQMAEVDALQDPWVGQPFLEIIGTFRNMRYLARTAILACEQQRQQADEAESKLTACEVATRNLQSTLDEVVTKLENRDQELHSRIESLTAQLSSIRDAGDEEVEGEFLVALQGDLLDDQREAIVKLHQFAISRGQQRDEVVGLLKWCYTLCGNAIEAIAADHGDEEGTQEARRILEIVEGKSC